MRVHPQLVVMLAICQASPQDYPQWRGAGRDGSASSFPAPKVWPEQLRRRWKVNVGEGYATPLVIGAAVYCFARRDDEEVMIAMNSGDGKVMWQTGYPAPYAVASPARVHGKGPKATPLFHKGKLYTLGIGGIVTAFEATNGKLLWQTAAGADSRSMELPHRLLATRN